MNLSTNLRHGKKHRITVIRAASKRMVTYGLTLTPGNFDYWCHIEQDLPREAVVLRRFYDSYSQITSVAISVPRDFKFHKELKPMRIS